MTKKRYTVTAALPYANGGIHLGHLAGAYLPADTFVRFLRMKGEDVLFVCGSDEHGVPITLGARKEGITPKKFVDKYHELMKKSFSDFGISFDIYSRTSDPIHYETASQIFLDLYKKNVFTEETSLQYYDEKEKTFLADRYIIGTCPVCGNENAYGDQCEKCGSSLSPKDLKNPRSALSGGTPVLKETKHWYLPLQKYEPWLKEWILEGHKEDWKPNVYGQCKSWLDNGLQPRAMTRDLEWGVPVPLPNAEGKVLYVWFDAPIGYISATKDYFKNKNPEDWKKYWLTQDDENASLIHFIGKDNIVFHCIIFPAILQAHGDFIVPTNVPANEFLNLEGEKLSTSRNWAVWLNEYLEEFPNMQDVLRYVLTAAAPETKDNDFTWKDFQARNNNELVAILGNFINRTFVLTHKFFEGKTPPFHNELTSDAERAMIYQLTIAKNNISHSIENFHFREALAEMMTVARMGNKYLTDTEPWKLINGDKEKTGHILNLNLQFIANLSILMQPFLPNTAERTIKMLNLKKENLNWVEAGKMNLVPVNHQLGEPFLLFQKIEKETIEAQLEKLHAKSNLKTEKTNASVSAAGLLKENISYDDFAKMDLRVGTILKAEKVEKADKLLKLEVDLGFEKRIIVSGIAQHFSIEELINKQVCVVANLAPKKIRGIESKGMILLAEVDDKLIFITPESIIQQGAIIK
jgi:methionyl-tRNA synthetase